MFLHHTRRTSVRLSPTNASRRTSSERQRGHVRWCVPLVFALLAAACSDDGATSVPDDEVSTASSDSAQVSDSTEDTPASSDTASTEPSESSGSTNGAESSESTSTGQELIVGATADPWVDASQEDQKRKPSYPLNTDVCQTLVKLGTDFSVQSSTAEVEYVGDNTFRFTLLDGVTFSDGTPATSEDMKYSLDYTATEPVTGGNSFIGPDSTTIIDERTIEVTPTSQNLRLAEQINHPTYSLIKVGEDPLVDSDVTCTGPFMVESYTPEEEIVVVRNDNYWGEAPPLDRITFRFYADDTTRALAIQNGEVDMIIDVPLSILDSVESLPGIQIARAPVGNTTLMYLARRTADGTNRVLADPLVRRALASAIDRDTFVNGVLAGNAEVFPHVAPPAVLGEFADMVEGVPYDPDEAARLLDEAGWLREGDSVRMRDGQPLKVTIIYSRADLTTAEFAQAMLRQVGFDAEVLQLDAGAYRDRLDTGDYDIDISIPNQNDANPAFLMALRWYSKASGLNAQIISPGPDTQFEALIDAILAESDATELRRLSAEAMHELVDVEVGAVTLAGGYRVLAMRDGVTGFEPHPSNTNQRWSTVSVTD